MPKKCFISHSYKDAEARERLLTLLPNGVEPFIFPPITLPPEQMVSNELIRSLLAQDGLIYLEGGNSEQSFWVAFERDYAARSRKQVFAYNPVDNTLRRSTTPPMELPVFLSHSHRDQGRTTAMANFMMSERCFDVVYNTALIFPGRISFTSAIREPLNRVVHSGGYMVLFWSQEAREALSGGGNGTWMQTDLDLMAKHPDRILLALVDPTPLPPSLAGFSKIQMYADGERSETQRIDDLIVRLYWLIYRNTRQNQLS